MNEVLSLLRSAEGLVGPAGRASLSALGPGLTVGGSAVAPSAGPDEAAGDRAAAGWLAKEGFAVVPNVACGTTCERLVDAIERLTAAELPATFVYLFDEPWRLGEQLRARVSAMLGRRYELVEDVWAWRIAPGSGRGWPPHRGIAEPILTRDAPELINTWVALSDAEADRACMHFVPLECDPSYPRALASLDAPLAAVRAAPLLAGSALAWNANILHWGGPCSARAKGARVSASFSLVRSDALAALGLPLAESAPTELGARLDAVAQQIETYGEGQPDVSEGAREWARATNALRRRIANLSKPLPPRGTVT
jgi:Phytanoyl-CoA dioxygenase (PhyH)